ncbi:hypothetical protein LTR36_006283 [Oleoguttula mirabilis]|uniref:Velvet domain-containing protein n=1 Tax=Oleoguttula mirabilis TaxID=1507867 RepID=A0AAV9JBX7_9PEZI|nr:hypothetical protein LTR36_006283 [Oleoguttula mirabilis]
MDAPIKGCIPVDNETNSSASRSTRDGKQITYRLSVLQQPMRARACGSGAKSSADRRPVDPPPIVELKIFQGEAPEHDITYNMNANYFLFATLEQARPIAHGRMADDKSRLTVLTGTPVAGMVYLDRPTPAGYFIFPDLSVRHEGVYRLSFSLYEELKEPKDIDKADEASRPATPEAHVTHRLEVKSLPFVVYSAKKFPGLTESTSLSRMVAEQGCRVRIRRDVRMRRREAKDGGKDWDEYEDETAQARARMSATPDAASSYPTLPVPPGFADRTGRPRSASNTSHISFANPLSRRTSQQDMAQGYQPPFGTSPHTPQGAYAQSSPYGPSPNHQYPQPPYIQQQPAMQPPPLHHHAHSYPPPPAMPAPAAPHQSYYNYAPAPPPASLPQPQYAPPALESAPQPQRISVDYTGQDARRSSTQCSAPPPMPGFAPQATAPSYHPYGASHNGYQPSAPLPQQSMYPGQHQSFGSQEVYNRHPPPQPLQPPARASGATTPLSSRSFEHRAATSLPPLQMPVDMASRLEPSSPLTAAPPSSSFYSSTTTPIDAHKRSYGSVFNDRHLAQPLRQGARPGTPGYGPNTTYNGVTNASTAPDDGEDLTGDVGQLDDGMKYRRSDGRRITRHVPSYDG